MNPTDFGNPLIFHLAPSSGQNIPVTAKLLTLPSASAVLCSVLPITLSNDCWYVIIYTKLSVIVCKH